jgi:hypothetical protein
MYVYVHVSVYVCSYVLLLNREVSCCYPPCEKRYTITDVAVQSQTFAVKRLITRTFAHTYMLTKSTCPCAFVHVIMHGCLHVCSCVQRHHARRNSCKYTYTHARTNTHEQMHAYAHIHTRVCTRREYNGIYASDSSLKVSSYSSRGPTSDGRLKPDLVCPGVSMGNVCVCTPTCM